VQHCQRAPGSALAHTHTREPDPAPPPVPLQCADIVNGIAPALLDWLRLGTDAQEMCAEAGVCGAPPPAFAAPVRCAAAWAPASGPAPAPLMAPQRPAAHASFVDGLTSLPTPLPGHTHTHTHARTHTHTRRLPTPQAKPRRARAAPRNDLTCPLCMFVVSKVKETLSDPITRQAVHDKTRAACGVMPEGAVRDACIQWADQYGAHGQHFSVSLSDLARRTCWGAPRGRFHNSACLPGPAEGAPSA
jgi:hypothetical protein